MWGCRAHSCKQRQPPGLGFLGQPFIFSLISTIFLFWEPEGHPHNSTKVEKSHPVLCLQEEKLFSLAKVIFDFATKSGTSR